MTTINGIINHGGRYKILNRITDDNGMHWVFNGVRVYCLEAEKEMREQGMRGDVGHNGYWCDSWELALDILFVGGYIEKIPS